MKTNAINEVDPWKIKYPSFFGEVSDGFPLGNGDLGALMLSGHRQTTFQLAKSDVWDERCDDGAGRRRSFQPFTNFAELGSLIEAGKWEEIDERWREHLRKWRGKFCMIPLGSLMLDTTRFEHEIEVLDASRQLDMKRGLAQGPHRTRVRRQEIEALASAEYGVIAIHVRCKLDPQTGKPYRAMKFGLDVSMKITPSDLEAKIQTGWERNLFWQRVRGYHQVDYTIVAQVEGKEISIETDAANQRLTVTSAKEADFVIYVAVGSGNGADTKAEAVARTQRAATAGYRRLRADNIRWWAQFWNGSKVEVPDAALLRQYHFGLYLLGASSRRGFPMPGIQGLWPMRPIGSGWNEYTNDINIQMNYWPAYTGNHLELTWPYYETVRKWLPETRRYTHQYYGCKGIQFSCCASPEGIMPPGYLTSCHFAGQAAFVAQNFWIYYLYTRDEKFLREIAFPFIKECAEFYLDFLKKDKNGFYAIWPSNMPEAGEGSYEAWGKNPTMDIALIKYLFQASIEGGQILRCDAKFGAECRERLDHMPSYPMSRGHLIEMESKEFLYSHRHPGVLTPVYPCADVSEKVAGKSIDRYLEKGKSMWIGFSPVWTACACARAKRGDQARDLLREFMEVFALAQGGFQLIYDYKGLGLGMNGPKCFTNETNSGFSAALLEMLLQSHDGFIHVFPAVPDDWKEVAFHTLRAQGAFLVSAVRKKGKTAAVMVQAERGGTARLKNPWPRAPKVMSNGRRISVTTGKGILSWETKRGAVYKLAPR